jgi:hypothetical protein
MALQQHTQVSWTILTHEPQYDISSIGGIRHRATHDLVQTYYGVFVDLSKTYEVSHLVAFHFIGETRGRIVRYKDFDPTHPYAYNLEIVNR